MNADMAKFCLRKQLFSYTTTEVIGIKHGAVLGREGPFRHLSPALVKRDFLSFDKKDLKCVGEHPGHIHLENHRLECLSVWRRALIVTHVPDFDICTGSWPV